MSRIRSVNTRPEELVRKFLFSRGLRYRKNVRKLPGCPDIVLPGRKTVVFVNGCFWHAHEGCPSFTIPKTRPEYWRKKLLGNRQRGEKNQALLKSQGWRVLTVWECELKKAKREKTLENLLKELLKGG
jgi:DNA mismatch endonuclease (patch repair protein)